MVKYFNEHELGALKSLLKNWQADSGVNFLTHSKVQTGSTILSRCISHKMEGDQAVIYWMSEDLKCFPSIKWHLPSLADTP